MFFEIVPSGMNVDFIGRRQLCAMLSAALILAGLGAVIARGGVPMGIDFRGGLEVQVLFDEADAANEARIREVVEATGIENATVVRFGDEGANEYLIKFPGQLDVTPAAVADAPPVTDAGEASAAEVEADVPVAAEDVADSGGSAANDRVRILSLALGEAIGDVTVQRVEFVGPKVGIELRRDGLNALLLAALVTLAYVAFRFSTRFAPGAVIAVVHDLAITGGLLVMLNVDFDLRILAAMLAIIGYSLNDTIIIYDRIRENMELRTTADLEEVLNSSVNQTLSRTVLTSLTTILALVALYLLGGEVIRPFALTMLIGVLVGTYSSIFIASPVLLFLERRYGSHGKA